MIIRRALNDSNKFTECCCMIKQTPRISYSEAMEKIKQELAIIDTSQHLTAINDEY